MPTTLQSRNESDEYEDDSSQALREARQALRTKRARRARTSFFLKLGALFACILATGFLLRAGVNRVRTVQEQTKQVPVSPTSDTPGLASQVRAAIAKQTVDGARDSREMYERGRGSSMTALGSLVIVQEGESHVIESLNGTSREVVTPTIQLRLRDGNLLACTFGHVTKSEFKAWRTLAPDLSVIAVRGQFTGESDGVLKMRMCSFPPDRISAP